MDKQDLFTYRPTHASRFTFPETTPVLASNMGARAGVEYGGQNWRRIWGPELASNMGANEQAQGWYLLSRMELRAL